MLINIVVSCEDIIFVAAVCAWVDRLTGASIRSLGISSDQAHRHQGQAACKIRSLFIASLGLQVCCVMC